MACVMRKFILFLATGFGSGYLPGIPGTYGSMVGMGIVYWMSRLALAPYAVTTVGFFFLGVWVSSEAERYLQQTDPGRVVIDEIVGVMVTMFLVPFRWQTALAGFLLFRVFDIWKPLSIRRLQHLPGGWGIMVDDLAAGIVSNLLLQIGIRYLSL